MNVLVVGGTSGLGLEIAKKFNKQSANVYITGRHDPSDSNLEFIKFDLSDDELPKHIAKLVNKLPEFDTVVYAAGYFQDGRVTDLTDKQIEEMLDVGGRGLIYLVKSVLKNQAELKELITITSTSQWTPRQREPIYNFVKAGSGHFSNALAEDGRIGKVLVIGPAGMQTAFWDGVDRDDKKNMLEPDWVADQVMKIRESNFRFKFAKILREPPRVEIEEIR